MLEDDCQMEQSCDFKHGSFYKMSEASKLMDILKSHILSFRLDFEPKTLPLLSGLMLHCTKRT